MAVYVTAIYSRCDAGYGSNREHTTVGLHGDSPDLCELGGNDFCLPYLSPPLWYLKFVYVKMYFQIGLFILFQNLFFDSFVFI